MTRLICLLPAILLPVFGCSLFVRPEAPELAAVDGGEEDTAVSVGAIESSQVPEGLSAYWDKVRAGGPFKIGINKNYPPFGVPTDPAKQPNALVAGFDVDLAVHLGHTLGVPVELVPISSQEVMSRLNDGSIDLAMAGLTRTVYRSAQVNFSQAYLTVSQAALVARRLVEGARGTDEERRRGTLESYSDLSSVAGLKIGTVKWTRPHRLALSNFPRATIVAYPTILAASQALIDGEVSALVHDAPYVRVWFMLHPGQAAHFRALLEPVTEEPIAIAMRKGDLEFLRFLDDYVSEVRGDGTVARLYRRHFIDGAWLKVAALDQAAR